MMNIKKIAFNISILLFLVTYSYSQEEINPHEIKEQGKLLIKKSELKSIGIADNFELFNRISQNELINNQTNNIQENTYITISQIGNYNNSTVDIKSNYGQIDVYQNGNNNTLAIDRQGNQVNESVSQIGNNNYIQDYSPNIYENSSIQLNQYGDNLSLYNYGTNSLTNSLNILQTGSEQVVYIISN
jgi:hypothetical protein